MRQQTRIQSLWHLDVRSYRLTNMSVSCITHIWHRPLTRFQFGESSLWMCSNRHIIGYYNVSSQLISLGTIQLHSITPHMMVTTEPLKPPKLFLHLGRETGITTRMTRDNCSSWRSLAPLGLTSLSQKLVNACVIVYHTPAASCSSTTAVPFTECRGQYRTLFTSHKETSTENCTLGWNRRPPPIWTGSEPWQVDLRIDTSVAPQLGSSVFPADEMSSEPAFCQFLLPCQMYPPLFSPTVVSVNVCFGFYSTAQCLYFQRLRSSLAMCE